MAKQSKILYNKLPKSFEDQVKLLKSRGLHFENEKKAEKILQFVSYNRLSNYWYPFLIEPKSEEIFKEQDGEVSHKYLQGTLIYY